MFGIGRQQTHFVSNVHWRSSIIICDLIISHHNQIIWAHRAEHSVQHVYGVPRACIILRAHSSSNKNRSILSPLFRMFVFYSFPVPPAIHRKANTNTIRCYSVAVSFIFVGASRWQCRNTHFIDKWYVWSAILSHWKSNIRIGFWQEELPPSLPLPPPPPHRPSPSLTLSTSEISTRTFYGAFDFGD